MIKRGSKNTLPVARLLVMLGAGLLLAGGYYWYTASRGDDPQDIARSRANLQRIWRAMRDFQSEAYFARVPASLQELHEYAYDFYVPRMSAPGEPPSNEFTRIRQHFQLVPEGRVFHAPTMPRPAEETGFSCDYTLLAWYGRFLPPFTAIAWDNPGNFKTGGNILFNNGEVRFYEMNPAEYRRFVQGLQTRSDRTFLRRISPEVSVRGFSEEPGADAGRVVDPATGAASATVPAEDSAGEQTDSEADSAPAGNTEDVPNAGNLGDAAE